jgi:hypothetical protein
MINLIPPDARAQVAREYWIRVVSVWVILLSVAGVIVGVLCMPSLVLVQSQLDAFGSAFQIAHTENDIHDELEAEVRVANSIARVLLSTEADPLFSSLIVSLNDVAGSDVVIRSINMVRTDQKVEEVHIMGVADSRTALVQFRDALEGQGTFTSAALPLSNLAKDKDVPFDMTIMVHNE